MSEYNPFDELGFTSIDEAKKSISEQQQKGQKLDQLIHQAFQQNEAGAELLAMWEESLLMIPTAKQGDDMLSIGINEGIKQFIRNIKLTINKVERGDT